MTAFDEAGEPVRQWTGAWELYADWFDGLIGTEPAFALTDSKTVANFMTEYRRPNLVSLHVVHNSHLDGAGRPFARVRPSRRAVFAHLERFDGVVFLTERQRADAAALLSDPGNLSVVPNGVDPPIADPAPEHDREVGAGVVVAGLTRRKRVHHALDVVRQCRAVGLPVTLRVYGDGPDADALHSRAADAGLVDAVTFAGHRDDAAEAFASASWTLLTSTSEGSPLVLAEAMSRGCIPIAYDVPYGPADLIVDGVDGLLVRDGDPAGAAAAVATLVAMAPDDRERIREAARATAARHDDRRIVAEWGRVQRAAARRHDRPAAEIDASRRAPAPSVPSWAARSPSAFGAFRATRPWSSGCSTAGAAHSCAPGGRVVTAKQSAAAFGSVRLLRTRDNNRNHSERHRSVLGGVLIA